MYCEYWRRKLRSNKDIEFPKKLCPAMASVTDGFSFAFLQECFVATLVTLAIGKDDDEVAYAGASSNRTNPRPFDGDNENLDDYKLWTTFKKQADILRKEVEGQKSKSSQLSQWLRADETVNENVMAHPAAEKRGHGHSFCKCQDGRPSQKGEEVVRAGRRAGSEVLPELPWSDQKHKMWTATAFEWRV